MAAEVRLANTSITELDPSLTKDVLYERLIDILNKNDIDEFGFLPFLPDAKDTLPSSGSNGLPLYPFIVQEHGTKLGIPIFCWVPLLDASNAVLKTALQSSGEGGTTAGSSLGWWVDPEKRGQVVESSTCLMILCPDSFTAMNARKRLVQEGVLDPQRELLFLDMALTFPRNCKSSVAWYHRKWLLCYMYKDHETRPLDPSIIEQQLKICHLAAERYPKCYYAWTMRHWLVGQLGHRWWTASLGITNTQTQIQAQAQARTQIQNDGPSLLRPLQEEFERMKSHMQRNISDHSTQQHLQQCMIQLSGKWIVQRVTEPLEKSSQFQNGPTPPTSTSMPGSQEIVLQWTRGELAARQQRKDEWCRSRENAAGGQPRTAPYKSSIKSIFSPAATFGKDEGAISLGDDENNMLASFPWVAKLWVSELARTQDLITTYPGHESLWYHLRFVYYGLRWLDCEIDVDDPWNVMEAASKEERQTLFVSPASEERFVEQLLLHDTLSQDEEDQEKQREWADRHLVWVNRLEEAVGA